MSSEKLSPLQRLEALKPFTEREAWNLYRAAALAEAFGWTILIIGILWRGTNLPGHKIAVPIAGNIHGSIFLIYFAVLLATYSSLGWSRLKFVIAAGAGVPPYGTLIFEQITAFYRRRQLGNSTYQVEARAIIMQGDTVLAVQPVRGTNWVLPGGEVASMPPQQALERAILKLTGITPQLRQMRFIHQSGRSKRQKLTLYFDVQNSSDFTVSAVTKQMKRSAMIEQIKFMPVDKLADVSPEFLQTERLTK